MTGLPAWIGAALERRLENVARTSLKASAQATSIAYRAGGTSEIIRTEDDALAYAVVRMPATYAAVHAALLQAVAIDPEFAPQSVLDVGAGPGTASWAALDCWPSVNRLALIDRNRPLLALARTLQEAAPPVDMTVTPADMVAGLDAAAPADVVMASYALTELTAAAAQAALARLWALTGAWLVLVEPGTVDGFRRILGYRDFILAQGGHIVAPCSHTAACPLRDQPRWCHFAARLPRSRAHLMSKDAAVPFEDEKFIALVAARTPPAHALGHRVLTTPRVSKAHVTLTLCAPDTVAQRVVPRRDKEAYRLAKRCDWGDAVG